MAATKPEDRENKFLKPLSDIKKAILDSNGQPIKTDTLDSDKILLCNFILAIRYIYSRKEDPTYSANGDIDNWLSTTSNNWFASTAFNESRCIEILNEFKKNFDDYKDLECFSRLKLPMINSTEFFDDYIDIHNEYTEKLFDLNAYFNYLTGSDSSGELRDPKELKASNEYNQVKSAANQLQANMLTNHNNEVFKKLNAAEAGSVGLK